VLSSLFAAIHDTGFGEFLPLSEKEGVPVLVRLHERQWGALARLPAYKLTEAGYTGWICRRVQQAMLGSQSHMFMAFVQRRRSSVALLLALWLWPCNARRDGDTC
jgi:hypothetical protein